MENHAFQKRDNLTNVFHLIHSHQTISRAELAKELEVTPPTISLIVEELLKAKLIVEKGTGRSIGGRKPILVGINESFGYVIALDIRDNQIYYGLYDFKGSRKAEGFERIAQDEPLVNQILQILHLLVDNKKHQPILGVGISISGVVSERNTLVYSSVFQLKDIPLKRIVEREIGIETMLEERVRSASMAYKWYNPGIEQTGNSLFLHVGKGIGASIIINGEICYGHHESSGEIGHMIVVPDGQLCSCGSRGCLETMASEKALIRNVKEAIMEGRPSILSADMDSVLTGERIVEAAESGDEVALQAVHSVCKYLAIGLINIIRMFDPATVRIMNTLSEQDDLIQNLLSKYLQDYNFSVYEWKTMIEFERDKRISLNGAAAVILNHLYLNLREKLFDINTLSNR